MQRGKGWPAKSLNAASSTDRNGDVGHGNGPCAHQCVTPLTAPAGTAQIAGTLVIDMANTSASASIPILAADTIVGSFGDVTVTQTYNGCAYQASQSQSGGTLTVLLSPSSSCGGAGGGAGGGTGSTGGASSKDAKLAPILAGAVGGALLLVVAIVVVTALVMRRVRGHWLWQKADDEAVLEV